jgi:hypothetical protein
MEGRKREAYRINDKERKDTGQKTEGHRPQNLSV